MAFKILALACLLAVALASPTLDLGVGVQKAKGGALGGLLGNTLNDLGGTVSGVLNGVNGLVNGLLGGGGSIKADGTVNLGLNLGGLLGLLGNAVTGVAGDAGSILKDLSNLRIPGTLDDVLNLVIGVGASLGGVLNAVIPGSGGLVGNLVIGLFKILICVLGSPGLTGNLLGDSRPGLNNPKDIPAICGPKFGVKFGLKPYDGGYKSVDGVIDCYGLGDIDDQLRALLDKVTNGAGLDGLDGSNRLVAQWLLDLSSLVKARYDGNDWNQKDTIQVIIDLSKILGGIGNGYKSNFGKRIVYQLFKYLKDTTRKSSAFKDFDWSSYQKEVIKQISQCNRSSFNGSFKKQDDSSYKKVENDKDVDYNYAGQDQYTEDEINESKNDQEQNKQQTQEQNNQNTQEQNNQNTQEQNNQNTQEQNNQNTQEQNNQNTQEQNNQNSQDESNYNNSENNEESNESTERKSEQGSYGNNGGKKTQIAEDTFKDDDKTGDKPQVVEDDFGGYDVDENGNYVKRSGSYSKDETSKSSSSKKNGKSSSGCSKTVASKISN